MFGFLKSNPDKILNIAEKGLDSLSAGADKLFYTEEEKAENAINRVEIGQKWAEIHIKLMETLSTENTTRSITRRYLAVMVIGVFLFLVVSSAAAYPYRSDWAIHIFNVAKSLSTLVLTIGIFYFGYYGVKETIKSVKQK